MTVATDDLFLARHGSGDPALLLLHGLGATGEVWHGLVGSLADRWPGELLVPDLPGHGRSAPLSRYSFGGLTAALAAALDPERPVVVLGHSLGGVLGLTLASGWFGVPVPAVCGLGIKVRWSPPELAKAAELARRAPKVFGSREEAVRRGLAIAGLTGLVPDDSPLLAASVSGSAATGWRLALDGAAFGVGAPDLPGLLAACRGEAILAAGETDPMSPAEHLHELAPDAVLLPGRGHNAHVESPRALWPLVDRLLAAWRSAADVDHHAGG